jgi:hypothetical protein
MNQLTDPKAFALDATPSLCLPEAEVSLGRRKADDPDAPLKAMLAAQLQSLDTLFADLVGQAAANMTEYPAEAEAYARLALRAQWNCRASIEAMSKLRYRDAIAARRSEDGR